MHIPRMLKRYALRFFILLCALATSMSATADLSEFAPRQELIGTARQQFGYAVAISGDYALIGRPEDTQQGSHGGSAYIYARQGKSWVQLARLLPRDGKAGDRFGSAVAITGNVAMVGAHGHNQERGAAYLFERRGDAWTQIHKFTASDAARKDYFGQSVALAGDYALVGAPGADDAGTQSGAVYVFARQQKGWSTREVQKLLASDAKKLSGFGTRVAMAGSTALVGAPEHDHGGGNTDDYGTAYVFELDRGVWLEVNRLQASDGTKRDYFGSAVALSDQEAVVGAYGHANGGAAYVFTRQAGLWTPTEVHKLTAENGHADDRFGAAVALSGRVMLVGAYGSDDKPDHDDDDGSDDDDDDDDDMRRKDHTKHNNGGNENNNGGGGGGDDDDDDDDLKNRAGAVYIFERQAESWTAVERLTASKARIHAHFGYAVALSATHALVGAPALLGGPAGQVYAYSNFVTNTAPRITSAPITTATVGTLYRYAVTATDADGDPLSYALTRAPAGMQITPTSGVITWTPTAPGTVGVTVEVSDDHNGNATQTYTITVRAPNQPPVITSAPVTTAMVGAPYRYQVTASDPDQDALRYHLQSAPAGMSIEPSGLITWTPPTVGTVSVQVQVDDTRGGSATQTYTITVSVPNQPPRITSTPVTSAEMLHVIPQVTITDAHLVRQTITLNGQPYTPGTPITVDGAYVLTVEATDAAGHTTVTTVRFALERPALP